MIRILEHFNTGPEKYSVVFTSGATGALKTVAECFAWDDEDNDDRPKHPAGEITKFPILNVMGWNLNDL